MTPPTSAMARSTRPLGAAVRAAGVDFAVHSRHATELTLVVWPSAGAEPREIALDPVTHRHGEIWSVHVPGLTAGAEYAWRAASTLSGPAHAFDPSRLLLDPYSLAVAGE